MVKVALMMITEEEVNILIQGIRRGLSDKNYINEVMRKRDLKLIEKLENLSYEGTLL